MSFVANQVLTAADLNDLNIDSLTVDTDTLVVDATNNHVGIGDTTPNQALHVVSTDGNVSSGDVADGTRATVFLRNSGGTKADGALSTAVAFSGTDSGRRRAMIAAFQDGTDGDPHGLQFFTYGSTVAGSDAVLSRVTIAANGRVGIGTTSPSTTLDVNGSLSKNSGSFKIDHPLPSLAQTHQLVHSFVEAPQADNIYRGQVTLIDGAATVDLDDAAGMTTGTFELLNRDLQCFIVNNDGWTAVRGSVAGATLTIEAQDAACTDTVDWLVIGERHDQHMFDTDWTDDNGRVIVEPEKPTANEES